MTASLYHYSTLMPAFFDIFRYCLLIRHRPDLMTSLTLDSSLVWLFVSIPFNVQRSTVVP